MWIYAYLSLENRQIKFKAHNSLCEQVLILHDITYAKCFSRSLQAILRGRFLLRGLLLNVYRLLRY